MSYTSPIVKALTNKTYDYSNCAKLLEGKPDPNGKPRATGCKERNWEQDGYGSSRKIIFDIFPAIPKRKCKELIKQRDQDNEAIYDVFKRSLVKKKNQSSTNFCWAYAAVSAYELSREIAGLEYIEFSPDSIAAPINNNRNLGGWPIKALEHIKQHGILPVSQWKYQHYKDNRYEDKELRSKYRITEYVDVINYSDSYAVREEAYLTALMNNLVGPGSYNWWRHAICSLWPALENDEIVYVNLNSHNDGPIILRGDRAIPNEFEAILSLQA